jgi:glycine cleavage system H protein
MNKKLLYTADHEWLGKNDGGEVSIGITDYAQNELGDIVYVELPEPGDEVTAGEPFGNVESVKAVSPVSSPVSGTVIAINEELEDTPELVNQSPLEKGWMIKIKLADDSELEGLMDLAAYDELLKNQD